MSRLAPRCKSERHPEQEYPEMPARQARWALACAATIAILVWNASISTGQSARAWPPERLRDTGLYADWTTRAVAGGNLPFSPQYPLWSDGAVKSRWVH